MVEGFILGLVAIAVLIGVMKEVVGFDLSIILAVTCVQLCDDHDRRRAHLAVIESQEGRQGGARRRATEGAKD